MSVFKKSLLSRNVIIPMNQMGGDIYPLLEDALKVMEGTCVEEGYIQRNTIIIFNYSCGVLKGHSVHMQVTFECFIANPFPGEILECVVEHNTKAGVKARLNKKDSPYIVFLARDHHNKIPEFSDLKENDIIRVTVLGQRFEINDPKISIIATLVEVTKGIIELETDSVPVQKLYTPKTPEGSPEDTPKTPEDTLKTPEDTPRTPNGTEKKSPKRKTPEHDQFSFYSKSSDTPPGKGANEKGDPKDYEELGKIKDWRKQLSHFDVAEFTCDGSPEDNIVFPPGSKWNTLEHFWQAAKLSLADQDFANELRVGYKNGDGDGAQAQRLRKGVNLTKEQLDQWDQMKMNVMYVASLAKFGQHPEKLRILCLTKNATLMHYTRGSPLVHFTHYEKVRDELCQKGP